MEALNQALEGIRVLGGLAAGAVVAAVVYQFASSFMPKARAAAPGGYGGMVANDWINTGLDVVLPVAFLGLAFFGFVAYSVYTWGLQ